MRRKFPFLPLFFIALAFVTGTLIVMRIRGYSATSDLRSGVSPAAPGTASETVASGARLARNDGAPAFGADGTPVVLSDGTSVVVERPASQSAREQRYNELLRAAPPSGSASANAPMTSGSSAGGSTQARPAVAQPQQSALQRLISPIVNAFSREPAPQTPRQQSQQKPPDEKPREDKKAEEPADPDSDTVPPQLISIEFIPPQVQDGEETVLAVTVTDNLSGVRSVSGVISSPSGALQGFACQREGETPRYVAHVAIPKDAAEGTWRVNYLTLTDNASNSVNLSYAQGGLPPTATFKVTSSRPDSAGPNLTAVYLERPAMRAGEKNTLIVKAEDEKSGVQLVSGVFLSPQKQARIGFGCRSTDTGTWQCDISPPACLDCGIWQLEQIQMQDKANNMTTARGDNPLVHAIQLDIAGEQCDSQPPQMSSLLLEPAVVSNMEASTINVTAMVSDDTCGVASISGQAVGPAGAGNARIYFSFQSAGSPDNWVGRLQIPKHAAKGIWTIAWIQILDKGYNLKTYSPTDAVLARAQFRVE
ncbi:MAG TPA: hypothetical protein VFN10_23960 [Thermoanaerobaculia bacterium]|nr:hypothetical protein [Thermoanaerobaculia bacterium]